MCHCTSGQKRDVASFGLMLVFVFVHLFALFVLLLLFFFAGTGPGTPSKSWDRWDYLLQISMLKRWTTNIFFGIFLQTSNFPFEYLNFPTGKLFIFRLLLRRQCFLPNRTRPQSTGHEHCHDAKESLNLSFAKESEHSSQQGFLRRKWLWGQVYPQYLQCTLTVQRPFFAKSFFEEKTR